MPTATTNAKYQARDDIDQGSSGALYFNTSHRSHPPGTTHRIPRGGRKIKAAAKARPRACRYPSAHIQKAKKRQAMKLRRRQFLRLAGAAIVAAPAGSRV